MTEDEAKLYFKNLEEKWPDDAAWVERVARMVAYDADYETMIRGALAEAIGRGYGRASADLAGPTPLYLTLRVGPSGIIRDTEISLTAEKRDAAQVTRGEGQAFVFRCIDHDVTSELNSALKSGEFIRLYGNKLFPVKVTGRD